MRAAMMKIQGRSLKSASYPATKQHVSLGRPRQNQYVIMASSSFHGLVCGMVVGVISVCMCVCVRVCVQWRTCSQPCVSVKPYTLTQRTKTLTTILRERSMMWRRQVGNTHTHTLPHTHTHTHTPTHTHTHSLTQEQSDSMMLSRTAVPGLFPPPGPEVDSAAQPAAAPHAHPQQGLCPSTPHRHRH